MEKKDQEELIKKLEECQKERSEYLAGWQRARADFLNYKKEEEKRLEEFLEHINEGFVLELLPILDSFERAEKEIKGRKDTLFSGFLQIKNQFLDFLKRKGLEEIETKKGERFDPNVHEVIEAVEKEKEKGKVLEVLQKGYRFKGKIMRPAKVRVAK
jgi:molecular chaperone GrpE